MVSGTWREAERELMGNLSDHIIPFEEAMGLLAVREEADGSKKVHTFMASRIGPLGADWRLASVKEHLRKHDVRITGRTAQAMKHGIGTIDDNGKFVAFETKERTDGESE
jgi:hypothetical protein